MGLQRVRVFDTGGSEIGSSYCKFWVLDSNDTEFHTLSEHTIRGIEIDSFPTSQYRYQLIQQKDQEVT